MDFLLALKIPGMTGTIVPPANVPTGGLFSTGQDVIRAGITFFLIIVILLAIFYLLIGALRYIFSRGDKQKIQGAREKITYSIVGLIIAFLAFALMTIVSQFFNVPLLSPFTVSVSHSCGACTNIDPINVTARGYDIKVGIRLVWVHVDKDGDGNAGNDVGESLRCESGICSWDLSTFAPGTYIYTGQAENRAGDNIYTEKKSFTITRPGCNLIKSCDTCIVFGCMWARSEFKPLGCYTISDGNICPDDYYEKYVTDCRPQGNLCTFTPPSCSGTCRRDEDGCVPPETISNSACSLASEICCVIPTPTPGNIKPFVNAGPDRVASFVLPGITISQTSNISDDCKPSSTITYVWNKLSGPGTVTFSNKSGSASCTGNFSAADTNITFTSVGTYVLELQVSDGLLTEIDIASFTINVSSLTPTISLPTPTSGPTPTPVPGACSGTVSLTLNPSSTVPGGPVLPSVTGLNNCVGKSVFFKLDSCTGTSLPSSCSISAGGSGCTASSTFFAPSSNTLVFACIDKNGDGNFGDKASGESDSKPLTIIGGFTPTPTPTPTPPPNPPDLQISWSSDDPPFKFSPTNPSPEEDITFEVKAVNEGGSISPETTVRFYKGDIEPNCSNNLPFFGETSISSLVPWSIGMNDFVMTGGFASPGTYRIWAFVDGACDIPESNENNNTQSIFVTVFP